MHSLHKCTDPPNQVTEAQGGIQVSFSKVQSIHNTDWVQFGFFFTFSSQMKSIISSCLYLALNLFYSIIPFFFPTEREYNLIFFFLTQIKILSLKVTKMPLSWMVTPEVSQYSFLLIFSWFSIGSTTATHQCLSAEPQKLK